MAQEDQVSDLINQDELLDAFNELFCEFKKEKLKNKVLMKENEKFSEENYIFNIEMKSLKSCFSDLENKISSLKIAYVDSLKNINSFKKKNMSYVFEKNFKHSYFNTQKHISIWVPKYLNLHEKENFITSYMNVRNDNDYVYANNWKSNSKWVWISKD
jgi:predicted nuclease with TOPRIM domain